MTTSIKCFVFCALTYQALVSCQQQHPTPPATVEVQPAAKPVENLVQRAKSAQAALDPKLVQFLQEHEYLFGYQIQKAKPLLCAPDDNVYLYYDGRILTLNMELYSESNYKYTLLLSGQDVGNFMFDTDFEKADKCYVSIDDKKLSQKLGGFTDGEFIAIRDTAQFIRSLRAHPATATP